MNNLNSLDKDKKIDYVYVLIIFFIILILSLSVYLYKVDKVAQSDNKYKKIVYELYLLDKGFNNFFLKSNVFNNYDIINSDINKFEDILELLASYENAKLLTDEYISLLDEVNEKYNYKRNYIESFKSKNSLLIGSIHYLKSLNDSIYNNKLLNHNDLDLLDKTFLNIMVFYINQSYEDKDISKNLTYFFNLNKKKNIRELDMFIKHSNINIKTIKELAEIKNKKYTLYKSIQDLELFLDNKFKTAIYNGRIVVSILFVIAFLFLIGLLIMYRRSLNITNNLISFTTAVENSYNSIVITDINKNITYVNDMAIKETGYSKEELIGNNPRVLKSGKNTDQFYKDMHESLDKFEKWEGEFINKRKDGSEYYEKASIMPIFQDGKLVSYLAIKLNITDYIVQQRKVKHMAYHDSLTLLPNRTNIEEYLELNIPIAKRNNLKIAVLFIDIDNFKNINDTLGHDVGDDFIKECAKILKSSIRKSDILARIGGDEFVIVLESVDSNYSSAKVCTNIIKKFQKPIVANKNKLSITVSIGISIFPNDADNYITLFKYADMAMYEAKENGKNNFKYYRKELSSEMHDRLEIEQALKGALKKDEIYLMYQPKYDIATQSVIAFETLARWENDNLGFIPPDKFISIAEDTNDILEIGLFIFRKACQDFLEIKDKNKSIETISINISTVQLYQKTFTDDIMGIVKELNIDTCSIMLEITETHIMKNIFHSMDVLNNLKKLGFGISIDDFGTGYSSLSYLKQFPIDELKIDKSFIDDLPHDLNDVAISKAIISLSKNMGYINVAEGIETKEQEEFLLEHGCNIGQGYLFCKPKKKDDLLEFLQGNLS